MAGFEPALSCSQGRRTPVENCLLKSRPSSGSVRLRSEDQPDVIQADFGKQPLEAKPVFCCGPALDRRHMLPSRQRLTRAVTRRVTLRALSIGLVVASVRRRTPATPATPSRTTVSVSSSCGPKVSGLT